MSLSLRSNNSKFCFTLFSALREAHSQFQASLTSAEADFQSLGKLDKQIKSFNVGPNPYTWFTMEALEDTWKNLQKIIKERDVDLAKELQRQEENDKLRKDFARIANAFHQWLQETRSSMMEGSGTLEQQLEATQVGFLSIILWFIYFELKFESIYYL